MLFLIDYLPCTARSLHKISVARYEDVHTNVVRQTLSTFSGGARISAVCGQTYLRKTILVREPVSEVPSRVRDTVCDRNRSRTNKSKEAHKEMPASDAQLLY